MISAEQWFEWVLLGIKVFINTAIAALYYTAQFVFEVLKQNPWLILIILIAITLNTFTRKRRHW